MIPMKFSEMKHIIEIYSVYLFRFKCGSWRFLNYIWGSHSTCVGPRCLHRAAPPAGVQGEAVLTASFLDSDTFGHL